MRIRMVLLTPSRFRWLLFRVTEMIHCTGYKTGPEGYRYCGNIIWPWQKRRTMKRYEGKFYEHTIYIHYGHRGMDDLTKDTLAREENERGSPRES